ncbi:MAG: glycosyltransferase [Candidatus Krumholzibacteria bacterium]|nr:glycosyltransferase [Candidatus Krumholzibacteria bacterium]MDH4337805.1 glycosyltransferase [Candidatus Krumholzibacteria bacterium]MDH5271157.1 glycosyltransferase [Candidatus Krumholzibacteria bacterium]
MRVAYYHEWSDGPRSGVFKKIAAQVRRWVESGLDVAVFNLSARDTADEWRRACGAAVRVEQVVWHSRVERLLRMPRLVDRMLDWSPDLVYRRYGPWYPAFDTVSRKSRLVLEVNTDDLAEARLHARHRYWYKCATRGLLLKRAAGIVFVSHEVSRKAHFAGFRGQRRVIANGVDLDTIRPLPAPQNDSPRLVFVGSAGKPFHGTDKILQLARAFPGWRFDLVGPGPDEMDAPLPDNVIAHGPMLQRDYASIMASADVAIASLALHRVQIHENSPLKMSEYLAWGIPVIAGYKDTNFMEKVDFILELPCSEDNVTNHVDDIRRFVAASSGRRVPREAIRHVGSDQKERERIEFFEQLCRGAGR